MRILLVDDEPDIRDQLSTILVSQKYAVDTAADGEEALDRIFNQPYDAIILDIMLPKRDGLEVLKEIRKANVLTPVILLTARSEFDDKIRCLDQGADDYLAKPFSAAELLARLRSLLHRASEAATPFLETGDIQLNTITREVTAGGNRVVLTPKEFGILEFLLYNKNRAVTCFNLAEHVWDVNLDAFTMSNYIDVHIKSLRRKIGDHDASIIRTFRGIGYLIKDEEG